MSPDYCAECKQAASRKAKFVETFPAIAILGSLFFWFLIPSIFSVDLRFITLIYDLLPINYAAYNGFQELASLGFFIIVAYLVAARIRNLYRRGLRVSWGLFPFVFWLRFHWLQTKPDANAIA